jgi:hypothetical protein
MEDTREGDLNRIWPCASRERYINQKLLQEAIKLGRRKEVTVDML